MKRVVALALVAAIAVAAAVAVAAGGSGDVRSADATAHAAMLRGPRLASPANGANVSAMPVFSWKPRRGAVTYEFQLAADRAFRSTVSHGAFHTQNTKATIDQVVADGTYYWRVRGIDKKKRVGRWSAPRTFDKRWNDRPDLLAPADEATINFPTDQLVLRWSPTPHAYKYLVTIASDDSLAQPVVTSGATGDTISYATSGHSLQTADTKLALSIALSPGRYYWAITPIDTGGHRGRRSAVSSFDWAWPSRTNTRIADLTAAPPSSNFNGPNIFGPQFSWDPIPGADHYNVEVNFDEDWAASSKVCCSDKPISTSLAPKSLFGNNTYYWRVRPVDRDGNAGTWSRTATFNKAFDWFTPSIRGLTVRDNEGALPASPTTGSPIVSWDLVPGASKYQVNVMNDSTVSGCDTDHPTTFTSAINSWTPLGGIGHGDPGQWSQGSPTDDGTASLDEGRYCIGVRPYAGKDALGKDVWGTFTTLGDKDNPAFVYDKTAVTNVASCPAPADASFRMPYDGAGVDCYIGPHGFRSSTPLFTWHAVPGARSYYVIVARDANFTQIVDEAFTYAPAYSPRTRGGVKTYADETTSYYYVVMPSSTSNGDTTLLPNEEHQAPLSPPSFNKASITATAMSPAEGADVLDQPVFRWTEVTGATTYDLEVARDDSFTDKVDDLTTHSTSYTSTTTYPADTLLYWRVRAEDAGGRHLRWSQTYTFTRRLAAPDNVTADPARTEFAPLLSWSPVPGATAYDVRLEDPDGDTKTFENFRAPVASAVKFSGTGVWRVIVRANFPRSQTGDTVGPWSAPVTFTRYINPPPNARGFLRGKHDALISWDPSPIAEKYKIQISTNDTFDHTVVSATTENTAVAPSLSQSAYRNGAPLYWRVAAVDDGGNVGPYQVGTLRSPRKLRVRARGRARMHHRSRIVVTVRDKKKRAVKKARVTVSGAGVRTKPRRTNRRGRAVFRVKPGQKGKLVFTAGKDGWDPGQAVVRVRR